MSETVYIIHQLLEERVRLVDALKGEPVIVKSYDSGEQFLHQVSSTSSGCVLVSVDLPGLRPLMVEIQRRSLALAVVVLGRDSEFTIAVELVRNGAFDFLEDPVSGGRLRSIVRRAVGTAI
ncbi:response regulator [Bradyrhizobium sp.]|jgi:FixJ family two-component response regulator|uniref:response regulator n=1 Tax=Bradyrhizobium sp. TaxID=376 RepID=UPI003C3C9E99